VAKREKIIIIITALTLVYGVYILFFQGRAEKAAKGKTSVEAVEKKMEDLKDGIKKAQEAINNSKPGVLASYIVANADVPYIDDPFYYRSSAVEVAAESALVQEETGPGIELVYSGFMSIGVRRIAIINDREYEVGDDVAGMGYFLRRIRPDLVEIESRDGEYFLRIPFEEEGY